MTEADELLRLLGDHPGLTERAISARLSRVWQRNFAPTCIRLLRQGRLRREGHGGIEPFRYFLASLSLSLFNFADNAADLCEVATQVCALS